MQRVNKPNGSDKTFLVIQDPEMSIEKLSKYFEEDRATAALLYKTADAIITEHDIVKLVASGKDAASTTVESIMTKDPVLVIADAKPVGDLNDHYHIILYTRIYNLYEVCMFAYVMIVWLGH